MLTVCRAFVPSLFDAYKPSPHEKIRFVHELGNDLPKAARCKRNRTRPEPGPQYACSTLGIQWVPSSPSHHWAKFQHTPPPTPSSWLYLGSPHSHPPDRWKDGTERSSSGHTSLNHIKCCKAQDQVPLGVGAHYGGMRSPVGPREGSVEAMLKWRLEGTSKTALSVRNRVWPPVEVYIF